MPANTTGSGFANVPSAVLTLLAAVAALAGATGASAGTADKFLVAEDDSTTFKRDGRCFRYLPNLGRAYEIPCQKDDDDDEPSAKESEPAKRQDPLPSAPSGPEPKSPPPAPRLGSQTAARILLPEKGSVLRAELMNAARPVFEREIGGSIVFSTKRLAAYGDWAFGSVHPLRANGSEIDWTRTKFAESLKAGAFEADTSFFLLKRVDGKWTSVETAIGPTDVTWDGWRQQYNLPTALFVP